MVYPIKGHTCALIHLFFFYSFAFLAPSHAWQSGYVNVLNASLASDNFFVLSDLGAWHGLALPRAPTTAAIGGPFIHGGTGLIADAILQYVFPSSTNCDDFVRTDTPSSIHQGSACPGATTAGNALFPGLLVSWAQASFINVSLSSFFISSRSAATQITITNIDRNTSHPIAWQLHGGLNSATKAHLSQAENVLVWILGENLPSSPRLVLSFDPSDRVKCDILGNAYNASWGTPSSLQPQVSLSSYVLLSYYFNASEMELEQPLLAKFFVDPISVYNRSNARWNQYITSVTPSSLSSQDKWLAVKAVCTLITNWRSAAGVYYHGGLYPSFINYQGFWAWYGEEGLGEKKEQNEQMLHVANRL